MRYLLVWLSLSSYLSLNYCYLWEPDILNASTHSLTWCDLGWFCRGDSLDNLDARSSWRSSWTPRSNAYISNYTRPQSAFYGSTSFYGGGSGVHRPSTLPSSYALDSLRSGAGTPSSLLSPQSHSPSSLSPTCSPEPTSNAGTSQQRSR